MGHSYLTTEYPSSYGSASKATIDTFGWLEFDTDPDYVLLVLETHFPVICVEHQEFPPIDYFYQCRTSIIRVTYRYPKPSRQCVCPMCFEKVSEVVGPDGNDFTQWCENWQQFITLIPTGRSVAVDCNAPEYGYGSGYGCYGTNSGGGESDCGETTVCVYSAIANPSSPTGFSYYLSFSYCGTDGACGCKPPSWAEAIFPPRTSSDIFTSHCFS